MIWYLASPYSDYDEGHEAAADDIAEQAALLMNAGVRVFSPICHSHPIAKFGIDDDSHDFWVNWYCRPFMDASCGLIVCDLPGWQDSAGVLAEIEYFEAMGKDIVHMKPGEVPRGL